LLGIVRGVISRTALMAAAARAAHLLVDSPPYLLDDSVATRMLGEQAGELLDYHRLHGTHPVLSAARAQVTARTHYTESRLRESGADQYVLLGAGLDSFAHRSRGAVRVFEVDHPRTQEYKKSVAPPGPVRYVPVDFATDDVLERLLHAGFDPARPAFVGWLGVSMYLDLPAIERVLAVVGGLAPGTELVADHGGERRAVAHVPVHNGHGRTAGAARLRRDPRGHPARVRGRDIVDPHRHPAPDPPVLPRPREGQAGQDGSVVSTVRRWVARVSAT
jgi:methyltransferase (TIGR00027 family)